jgi:hypothetical protein
VALLHQGFLHARNASGKLGWLQLVQLFNSSGKLLQIVGALGMLRATILKLLL